jgi:hypothetical protein
MHKELGLLFTEFELNSKWPTDAHITALPGDAPPTSPD